MQINKKLGILIEKIKLSPRNSRSQISKEWSNNNIVPFPNPEFMESSFPPSLSFFYPKSSVSILKGWKRSGRKNPHNRKRPVWVGRLGGVEYFINANSPALPLNSYLKERYLVTEVAPVPLKSPNSDYAIGSI